jgi:hypothetical protein
MTSNLISHLEKMKLAVKGAINHEEQKSNHGEPREKQKTAKLDRNPGVMGNAVEPYSNSSAISIKSVFFN